MLVRWFHLWRVNLTPWELGDGRLIILLVLTAEPSLQSQFCCFIKPESEEGGQWPWFPGSIEHREALRGQGP